MTGGFFKKCWQIGKLASPLRGTGDWWMVALDTLPNLASLHRNGMVALDIFGQLGKPAQEWDGSTGHFGQLGKPAQEWDGSTGHF
jgi:hypothetical protein